jgi:hypothetical protein
VTNDNMSWFRPLWRRVAVTAFCVAWCAWEWLYTHDQWWSLLTTGLLAYAVWTFFINFKDTGDGDDKPQG